jgi:hypothetical protein
MKKIFTIIPLMFFASVGTFAQNKELSDRLIMQFNNHKTEHKHHEGKHVARNCITPLLLEVKKNWSQLTDEAKQTFKIFSERPILDDELIYSSENFDFHYTLTGNDAVDDTDDNGNDIPDFVEMMANAFEESVAEMLDMGYAMPPSDGDEGGSEYYDVYLYNIGDGLYGYVAPETTVGNNPNSSSFTEASAMTSYMGMNSDYSWASLSLEDVIKVTAAHEFFHSIQFGIASDNTNFLSEATAAWIEDIIYPGIDDNLQYMGSILKTPDVALNWNSENDPDGGTEFDGHWYGSWMFFRYISEKTNNDVVRKAYYNTITEYEIPAINAALVTYSKSFNNMFKDYLIALDAMSASGYGGYNFSRAADYSASTDNNCDGHICYESDFTYNGTQLSFSSINNGNERLMRLSADYFNINTNDNFTIEISPLAGNSAPLKAMLLKYKFSNQTLAINNHFIHNSKLRIDLQDNQNYDAYSLIIYRDDFVTNNQNDTESKDYTIVIKELQTSAGIEKDEIEKNNSLISIYPNPSNGFIFVDNNSDKKMEKFEIYNQLGQIVDSKKFNGNSPISVSTIENGVYTIKFFDSENEIAHKKLVLAR